MTKVSFGETSAGDFFLASEFVRYFLVEMCFDSGDVSISVCFLNSLKNNCCRGDGIFLKTNGALHYLVAELCEVVCV